MISKIRRQTFLFPFLFSSFSLVQEDGISFEVAECDRDTFIWALVSINVATGIN